MNPSTRYIRDRVAEALRQAGATELAYSRTGSCHQRFDFLAGGVKGRFVFACTPKSDRSVLNAVAVARRTVREYMEGRRGSMAAEVAGGRGDALLG